MSDEATTGEAMTDGEPLGPTSPADDDHIDDGWSSNNHYQRLVLKAIPSGARRALDVGSGEGALVRRLALAVPEVVGLERHRTTVERAARRPGPAVSYVCGDLLDHPFVPGRFDLVASIAALHHGPLADGLERLAELVAPGGALVVIGLARSQPRDWPMDAVGAVAVRVQRFGKPRARSGAPIIWPPADTYASARSTVRRLLPDAEYRRHTMFRYSLTWRRSAR